MKYVCVSVMIVRIIFQRRTVLKMMKSKILQTNKLLVGKHENMSVITRSKVHGILILHGTDGRMSDVFSGGGGGEVRVPEDRLQWQPAAVTAKNV
jgi:hypothetical protein